MALPKQLLVGLKAAAVPLKLILPAKFFDVSVDYLLGLKDEPGKRIEKRVVCAAMPLFSSKNMLPEKSDRCVSIENGKIHLNSGSTRQNISCDQYSVMRGIFAY